ncbi:extracellular solute-binding protein [Butyrivibrio sp. MC2021]|uniref:extracellular solute-binding protein n=1 Tax=Butyrivibrio sp. MC2021 TaxID=1408306 RepID=UPI00047B4860|nr:extracellular solute-binding protein [Butyrivibrio sp. MC2021]
MKMKKVLSTLLTGVMVFSLMGCGEAATTSAPAENETTTIAETATPKADAPAADAAGEQIDLTMWCIATESDSNRHSYEAAIADMAEKYPNVNFTWEAFENQSYKTKIKAAVSANEMPDIFFTWSCAFLGDFV